MSLPNPSLLLQADEMAFSCLPFKRLDPATPSLVQDILSLANKYEMLQLRDRIVTHLEGDWPQSLWQWDRLEAEVQATVVSWEDEFSSTGVLGYPDDHLPEPASAILLARSCNIPTILPAAFYHLSRLSIHNDRHSSRQKLSTQESSSYHDCLKEGQRTANWELLSTPDYISLLRGRAALREIAHMLCSFVAMSTCIHSSTNCFQSRQVSLIMEIRDACMQSLDILETTRIYTLSQDFGDGICSKCCKYLRVEL